MSEKKKYVVLEHLLMPNKGMRFFSMNSENNTHSIKGELWYKEVMFTDEIKEAQACIRLQSYPTMREMLEYYGTKDED